MAAIAGLSACDSHDSDPAEKSSGLIEDAVHHEGAVGFYFLPPMVAQPALDGTFDASIAATVRITEILDPTTSPATLGDVVAEYSTAAGTEAVADDHYEVNWKPRDSNVDLQHEYRISVSSGDKLLGVADVLILANGSQAKNVNSGEIIPLSSNQTLPIKFWMNLCAPVVCGDACAVANSCSPATGACAPKAAGTGCRAAAAACDAAETCDGVATACPADGLAPAGTACTFDGDFYSAASVCSGASDECPVRDWAAYPAVAEVDGAPELWVMSDVHGDYVPFTKLLKAAGIIAAVPDAPEHVQWSAGQAVFVIVGDLIDKGPDSHDVVRLVNALGASAQASGGRVVATLGNHEAEFLGSPLSAKPGAADGIDPELPALFPALYPVPPLSLAEAIAEASTDTAAGENDIGAFIRHLPVAARVNDFFFVHAGKTAGRTIAQLTSDIENAAASIDPTTGKPYGFQAPEFIFDSGPLGSELEARLSKTTPQQPQWWDVNAPGCDAKCTLRLWAQALGVKHIAMGHQPGAVGLLDGTQRVKDRMFQYNETIFLVDTGLSVGADKTGGALLHVTDPGLATEAWEEVLPSGARGCGTLAGAPGGGPIACRVP